MHVMVTKLGIVLKWAAGDLWPSKPILYNDRVGE